MVSALCAIPTYFISGFSSNSSPFIFVLGTVVFQFVVFFGLYLLLAPFVGIINSEDIVRLKSASSGIRYFSKVFQLVINIESRFVRNKQKAA